MKRLQAYSGRSRGFTLVEIAIVLLIASIMLGFGAKITVSLIEKSRKSITQNHLSVIQDALASYAQINFRLPCPADPTVSPGNANYGIEIGSGGLANIGNCASVVNSEGIVPFRVLGLDPVAMKDGWGNYITYRVSPVMTLDPETARSGSAEVHEWCRVDKKWIYHDPSGISHNRNSLKAFFCCPPPSGRGGLDRNSDVVVRHATGASGARLWYRDRDVSGARFASPDTGVSSVNFTGNDRPEFPAYVLISHGKNEYGAFLPENPGFLRKPASVFGTEETFNQQRTSLSSWILQESRSPGNAYFDDIVTWSTNWNAMKRNRSLNSCGLP